MDILLNDRIHSIELIVFDCDGVLLDTMPAKIEAFQSWVPETHQQLRAPFMSYIMGSFGKSRSYHIQYFYRQLADEIRAPGFIQAEIDRFTEICEPLCATASWCTGSREFVSLCQQSKIPLCVLSGTPQAPLEAMLESAGGSSLFDKIIGSPPGKPESMERILEETRIAPEKTLFIGDAAADMAAATHVGAHFVYFPSEANRPVGCIKTEVTDLRLLLPEAQKV